MSSYSSVTRSLHPRYGCYLSFTTSESCFRFLREITETGLISLKYLKDSGILSSRHLDGFRTTTKIIIALFWEKYHSMKGWGFRVRIYTNNRWTNPKIQKKCQGQRKDCCTSMFSNVHLGV